MMTTGKQEQERGQFQIAGFKTWTQHMSGKLRREDGRRRSHPLGVQTCDGAKARKKERFWHPNNEYTRGEIRP